MPNIHLIICTPQQKSYFSKSDKSVDYTFVTSEAEFEAIQANELAKYKNIVIFAELLWQGKKYTDFYGMDIAVRLRLELKALAPVYLLSFLSRRDFGNFNEPKYRVLKARGTGFLQLPVRFDTLDEILPPVMPLSVATLTYLHTLLICMRHLIDVLNHNLRIEYDNENIRKSLEKIEQLSATDIYQPLRELADRIISAHANRENDKNTFYNLKNELIGRLNAYSRMGNNDRTLMENVAKHRILLVDDNVNDLNWAKNALADYFDVKAVRSACEAIEEIDKDKDNDYSGIICDWQLLNEQGEHQEMLGFEILEYASKRGLYALFSLTQTDNFTLREMNVALGFDHELFTKDLEMGDALWKLYVPIIQQKIDKVRHIISSIPTGKRWKNPKVEGAKSNHEQYLAAQNSVKWLEFKDNIADTASKLWNFYEKNFLTKDKYGITEVKNTLPEETLAQKGISSIDSNLEDLLVARRIYLAFWFSYKKISDRDIKNEEIYKKLGLGRYGEAKDITTNTKQFVLRLCIQSEKLPQRGVLPEEKAWLKEHGIEMD